MGDQKLTYLRELLNSFFRDEVFDSDDKKNILNFIQSENIRTGEYEGNIWVIQKLDQNNFILYDEDQDRAGTRVAIHRTLAIQRDCLVKLLMEYEI